MTANDIVVSVTSLSEIAIKYALGVCHRTTCPFLCTTALHLFCSSGYALLDIMPSHVLMLETLPPLHGDPFDRMLVAQALAEPLRLLTHDARIARYSDTVILV